jgi:glucosamine--fructose-6-phosphate aminotransferase (isomerizing)
VIISDQRETLALAQSPMPLPPDIPEWLTPLVAIVPAQLFTHALTRIKGWNTEAPRSIHKVTETH